MAEGSLVNLGEARIARKRWTDVCGRRRADEDARAVWQQGISGSRLVWVQEHLTESGTPF